MNNDVEFAVNRDEWGHPIRFQYKVNNRQPDNMPVINFLKALEESDKRMPRDEVEKIKEIAKPDVELHFDRDKEGYVTNMLYTIHNREPEGHPVIEFIEILHILYGDYLPEEQLQPA